jgi:hypothetical protein
MTTTHEVTAAELLTLPEPWVDMAAWREVRTMLGRLAEQLESIEPAGPAEWTASNFVSGVKHLPVSYRFK